MTQTGGARAGGDMRAITYRAPGANNHGNAIPVAVERSPLIAAVQAFARHVLETGVDLDRREQRFLSDLLRPDLRYGFGALDRLLTLAPRARNPHGLEVAIRGQVLRLLPAQPECVIDATLDETTAQGSADPWQLRFLVERTSAIRDAAMDKVGLHLTALQRYHDLLNRWTPNGRRFA